MIIPKDFNIKVSREKGTFNVEISGGGATAKASHSLIKAALIKSVDALVSEYNALIKNKSIET